MDPCAHPLATPQEQTLDVLTLIDTMLQRAGTDKSRILMATIFMVDLAADYASMNEVWDSWVTQVGEGGVPPSSIQDLLLLIHP